MKKVKPVTSKMQKIVSERVIINSQGKEETVKSIRFSEKDFNFQKIWVHHLLSALDAIGNQKVKILMWLIDNKNNENIVIATQQRIAEETKCVRQTVASTLQLLVDAGAMTLIHPAVYQLNPDLIFKGQSEDRATILLEYEAVAIPKKAAREAKADAKEKKSKPKKPKLKVVGRE